MRLLLSILFIFLYTYCEAQNSYTKRRVLDAYNYQFDADAIITFPHSTALNFERTQAWTFEAWLYFPVTPGVNKVLYRKYNAALTRGMIIQISTGSSLIVLIRNNNSTNQISVSTNLYYVDPTLAISNEHTKDRWIHLSVSYDGSSNASGVKIYYNGRAYGAPTINANTLSATMQNTDNIEIGIGSDHKQSTTRMFNRALSAAEIKTLYNKGVVNFKHGLSGLVLDMQVRKDAFATNFTVIDSALGNNGVSAGMTAGQKERITTMDGMNDMQVQTYTGNSIYYKTYGKTGGENTGAQMHSPLSSRFTQHIWYDSINQTTLIGWHQRPKIGFDRQSRLLKVMHNGKIVTPSGHGNYIYPGQIETHSAPSVCVTPNGEILLAHEEGHNSPIYIERTVNKSIGSIAPLTNISGLHSYPQFSIIGTNVFLWLRGSTTYTDSVFENDDIYKSSDNGATWSRNRVLNTTVGSSTYGVYERPYTVTVYDTAKLRFMVTMRDDNVGRYTNNYYLESTDGNTFSNITGTFSKNVSTSGIITKAELDANYLAKADTSDVLCKASVVTPSGKLVSIINADTTHYNILHHNGTSWVTKNLPIPTYIGAGHSKSSRADFMVLYPYSDTRFILWRVEPRGGFDVVVQYETTDFFTTVDAGTIVSATNKNHQQIHGTQNLQGASKIVIAATALGATENELFIYEFTP